jgi:glycosyltransferase involved in cell wall biosynthesis
MDDNTNPMKIVFLCNNFKSQNGVERVWSQKLSMLAEHPDFDVFLITYNQYGNPFSFQISDKVYHIDLATRYISRCSFHGIYQYIDRYKSERLFRKELDRFLNKLSPDIITCADLHVSDLKAVLSSTVHAVRIVECHCGRSAYFEDVYKHNHLLKRLQDRYLKKQLISAIRKFDKVVVMTEAEKEDWELNDKVVCIPNMMDICPRRESVKPLVHKRVISVGRYAYQKGFDLLLESWCIVQKSHPDWALHIYGSHDGGVGDYERLQEQIKQNQIDNVFLHQFTNDVYACYSQSDFYVMSSRFESFGLVLIEAMACGLPVISFGCKYGPRSIIQNRKTGLLVPQGNTKELAVAICSMIEQDEERQQMAMNAKSESKKYQLESIMPIWCDFYKSLVAGRSIEA